MLYLHHRIGCGARPCGCQNGNFVWNSSESVVNGLQEVIYNPFPFKTPWYILSQRLVCCKRKVPMRDVEKWKTYENDQIITHFLMFFQKMLFFFGSSWNFLELLSVPFWWVYVWEVLLSDCFDDLWRIVLISIVNVSLLLKTCIDCLWKRPNIEFE